MKRLSTAAFLLFAICVNMVSGAELADSIDYYEHVTVSDRQTVTGKDILVVDGVNVTSTGDLKLSSPNGVYLDCSIYIEKGGRLNVGTGFQNYVSFIYDKAGNRIRRQKGKQY